MKTFLISTLLFLTLYSCSSDSNNVESETMNEELIQQYNAKFDRVGELHNLVLDSVFFDVVERVKTRSSTQFKDKKEALQAFEESYKKIFANSQNVNEFFNDDLSQENLDLYALPFNDETVFVQTRNVNDETSISMSVELKSLVGKLYSQADICGEAKISPQIFNDKVDEISLLAIKTLKGVELDAYFTGASTAKYSYAYWLEKQTIWESLCAVDKNKMGTRGYNYKNVSKADVGGAVAGALVGAAAGGVGAGPGALGGGCSMSIVECISQLWDNLF